MVNQKLGYSSSLTVRLYTFSKLILKDSSLMQDELLHLASAHENKAFLLTSITAPQDAHKRIVLQVYHGLNTLEFSAMHR